MLLVELNSKSTIAFTSYFDKMPRSLIGRKVNSHSVLETNGRSLVLNE